MGRTPALENSANLARLYWKPEHAGTASHPCCQINCPTSETHFQTTNMLSKRSLSDIERQAIHRVVRQKTHNLPVLPLSPLHSIESSEISDSLPEIEQSFPCHKQQLRISPSHSQGSVHTITSVSLLSTSDSNSDNILSLPFLQSAPFENSISHANFAESYSIIPKLNSADVQRLPPCGSAKIVEDQEGIWHKLQELERELLNDCDESAIILKYQESIRHKVQELESELLNDYDDPAKMVEEQESSWHKLQELERELLSDDDDSAKTVKEKENIWHMMQELERELLSGNDDSPIASVISPEESNNLYQKWDDNIWTLLSGDVVLSSPSVLGESYCYP